jgi:hypothetical protein
VHEASFFFYLTLNMSFSIFIKSTFQDLLRPTEAVSDPRGRQYKQCKFRLDPWAVQYEFN